MTFELKMTKEQVVSKLRDLYGVEFTTPDVRAFCTMNDISYSTVTKKLREFKVTKGKWNLEVTATAVQDIERSLNLLNCSRCNFKIPLTFSYLKLSQLLCDS